MQTVGNKTEKYLVCGDFSYKKWKSQKSVKGLSQLLVFSPEEITCQQKVLLRPNAKNC